MLLYPRLAKSADRGLFVPTPVFVNVGGAKEISTREKLETQSRFLDLEFLRRLIKDVVEI